MLNLKHSGTFIDNTITNVPADATNVGGNSETLIDQGTKLTNILESSGSQSIKHVSKLLGIPISEAHNKVKEIKKLYEGNPDIIIDSKGKIKLRPTTGKNKGKEFDTDENVTDYK